MRKTILDPEIRRPAIPDDVLAALGIDPATVEPPSDVGHAAVNYSALERAKEDHESRLTDAEWKLIEPAFVPWHARHRVVADQMVWRARHRWCPWTLIPEDQGNWFTARAMAIRLALKGTWQRAHDLAVAQPDVMRATRVTELQAVAGWSAKIAARILAKRGEGRDSLYRQARTGS